MLDPLLGCLRSAFDLDQVAPFSVSQDAMSADLDPAAIESLLYDGARRRGMSLDAYRDLVQATADGARVSFATALLVISDFEKMLPGERRTLVEQLAILEQEAARYGVSVGRFVAIMLDSDDGESLPDTDPSLPH